MGRERTKKNGNPILILISSVRLGLHRASNLPEVWFVIFSLVLHFAWEMLQAPWFAGMTVKPHWIAVVECSRMTAGDAMIALFAFWGAAVVGGRRWFLRRRASAWVTYLSIGLVATIVLEWLSTEVWRRWTYASSALQLPGLGTGLAPLLQWLLLPPFVAWLAAGQIRGLSDRPLPKSQ